MGQQGATEGLSLPGSCVPSARPPSWPPPSPLPAGGRQLVGGSGEPRLGPPPLTPDKYSDLKQSRELQPFHQERFNLSGVRSHKS